MLYLLNNYMLVEIVRLKKISKLPYEEVVCISPIDVQLLKPRSWSYIFFTFQYSVEKV